MQKVNLNPKYEYKIINKQNKNEFSEQTSTFDINTKPLHKSLYRYISTERKKDSNKPPLSFQKCVFKFQSIILLTKIKVQILERKYVRLVKYIKFYFVHNNIQFVLYQRQFVCCQVKKISKKIE